MKFIKISRNDSDGSYIGSYIQPLSEIHQAIDGELDGDNEAGTKITLEFIEMTEEEYESLAEFTGW